MILPIGKLDSSLLEEAVFKSIKYQRDEVLQRPAIGEDCAVLDFGEYECVMSTDPITGSVEDIGKLAINITLNDIASNGVEPFGIMLAIMLPYGTTDDDIAQIMTQAGKEAQDHGIEIIGGHTEVTEAVTRPVIVSTALGRCLKGKSVNSENIKAGDRILISKEVGLEGIGIVAADRKDKLEAVLSKEELAEARSFITMTSVVKEGLLAGEVGVSGMHDITEGGILGAVWEMCKTSGLGAEIIFENIPVSRVTEKICSFLEVNPLRLISSGAMLIVAEPEKAEKLIAIAAKEGVRITDVGVMKAKGEGCSLLKNGIKEEIDPPGADELYKALS